MNPHLRSADLTLLHPLFLEAVQEVFKDLHALGIPFEPFEAVRSPERQTDLYAQGRFGQVGPVVTKAKAWESLHQYGFALDCVPRIDNVWSWDSSGDRAGWWDKLEQIAPKHGLRTLNFERPHIEWPVAWEDLKAGKYPGGGSDEWAENLAATMAAWKASGQVAIVPPPVPARPGIA